MLAAACSLPELSGGVHLRFAPEGLECLLERHIGRIAWRDDMDSDGSGLAGCRVLVVEDEARVATLIGDTLEDIGCDVVATATRFDDALDKATSLSFDVALLDVNLNGRESYPIAEALDELGRAFVFATGYDRGHLPPSLQDAPVLRKPFVRRDLERALKAALA